MVVLQPADWQEFDDNYKYVVDIYGRTDALEVARVRLTGFSPYFYLRAEEGESPTTVLQAIESTYGKKINGLKITQEFKLDAMQGFTGLEAVRVWKLSSSALWMFKVVAKVLRGGLKIGSRRIVSEDIYEANLPPFIRLFHTLNISPASPVEFDSIEEDPEDGLNVDVCYTIDYRELIPEPTKNIPMYVLSYDIEVYSDSGMFPVASNDKDSIIQIGMSFRWSNDLLTSSKRLVLVLGTVDPSQDPNVTFISCATEKDLLKKFEKIIHEENPDAICGYNTFGFDDGYIADRAELHRLTLSFGRTEKSTTWRTTQHCVNTECKTFELASGKFAVKYFDMPGRLPIDLLLSVRREQNLDSYKLDSVANTFLRDKVTNIVIITGEKTRLFEIHTKNTRGLFPGNLVRFDIVGNTMNPYHDGMKFKVVEVKQKKFIIELEYGKNYLCDFEDISHEDRENMEWSFAKDDVTPKEMFASHRGTSTDRALVAKYCIQDCDLVLTLMAKLDTLVNARGMADVCRVPVQYIFLRGQGIKIFSAVVYNASKRNQIIMAQENVDGDSSYEGAIVLSPKIGMYLEQPISVLDFNSLYPSNMIAYNLSPDTLVYVKRFDKNGKKLSHKGSDGVEFKEKGYIIDEIGYDVTDEMGKGRMICGFVQPKQEDPRTVGILPLTLDILLKKRKETRKLMETVEDDAQKSVLNGLQLAYKVVANSVYGQCGSKTSPIRKLEVAACTTASGRDRIIFAKKIVMHEFGAEVVYGDSVSNTTPVIIRENGLINIVTIEDLGSRGHWKECSNSEKEYCELQNIDSWTESGWTPIHRIIRHKLASHKKMIRVLTHTGLVDVTDDHSLLKPSGEEVSSKELQIGDELMHHEYPEIEFPQTANKLNVMKAKIAGFFFGDGSCGNYDCPSGKKSSWALNNANIELLGHYKELCEQVYPEFEWNINTTLVSSGVFKLSPTCRSIYGALVTFVTAYRNDLYCEKSKVIPLWIMNGCTEVRQAFWDGLYDADGDKDMNGYVRIDQKNQLSCAHIAWLGNTLGYKISLNDRSDKLNICRITFTKSTQRKNSNAIKKMYEIPYEGYVYDLTTDNHHFQAGIGKMIVHNTDSIFIKFPTKDLSESIKLGQKAAKRITDAINRSPYKIEYEKTFFPFILFCRKRYVGMMYEDDVNKCKRKSMGIALKRRDNAPIVKDIFGGALDILMAKRDIRTAQQFVKDMLVKVMKNEIPLDKYIITKQLRDDYKTGLPPEWLDKLRILKDDYQKEKKEKEEQGKKVPAFALGDYVDEGLVDKKLPFNKINALIEKYHLPKIQSSIAHRVLADRMTDRDAGNKPQLGDRLPYIYVANRRDEKKQGNKIEHIDYVKENNLKPDVEFYITNQIQNPVAQLFALALEKLEGYISKVNYDRLLRETIEAGTDEEEATLNILKQKEKELESLMFTKASYLTKHKRGPMDMFIKR